METLFSWLSSNKKEDPVINTGKINKDSKNLKTLAEKSNVKPTMEISTIEVSKTTPTPQESLQLNENVNGGTNVDDNLFFKCKECHLLFLELSNPPGDEYVCKCCQISGNKCTWSDEWNPENDLDILVQYELPVHYEPDTQHELPVEYNIPAPPPLPAPYRFPSSRLQDKNSSGTNFIETIDWEKVTSGWLQLYEDCQPPVDEWDIEKGLPMYEVKDNESSEEYFIPKKLKRSKSDSDMKMVGKLNELIVKTDKILQEHNNNNNNQENNNNEYDDLPPLEDTEEYSDYSTTEVTTDELTDEVMDELSYTSTEETVARYEGTLELIIGPMYSGKSTAAILKLAQMADIGFDVLYINHSDDIRITEAQDGVVSTHNSQYKSLSKKITPVKVNILNGVDVKKYQYIGIDEGQFFPDLYETVLKWVTAYGKSVIVASLDGDAYRRKFGQVLDLIPNADSVVKLKAYCDKCRNDQRKIKPAPFTARLSKGTEAKVVGGRDLYVAMCRECHDKHLTDTAI